MKCKISIQSIIVFVLCISSCLFTCAGEDEDIISAVRDMQKKEQQIMDDFGIEFPIHTNLFIKQFNQNYSKFQTVMRYLLEQELGDQRSGYFHYERKTGKLYYEDQEITHKTIKDAVLFITKELKWDISNCKDEIVFSYGNSTISYFENGVPSGCYVILEHIIDNWYYCECMHV